MVFFCFHCGAQYNLRSQLTRHVRDKHPKKMLQCRFCSYLVPTSKRFRLNEHEKNVHRHILNPRTNNRELVIQETPRRKPVPTSNFNTRQSCTVTRPREVTPPTTPILTRSIKPISPLSEISPCSISLGIEDYSSVSPVKKNLVDLFDSPTRQAVEEPREETNGTVYKLSATWVPDPSFQILKSEDTQTEERQVQQTSTQTDDKRVVLTTTATQTRRVIKKESEVQTEDCRVVMEKDTEEELELDIEEEYMDFDFYH
ncbi:Hypothetical predicted protein [Mytilus galloprovincialis]|uniref:C2H2-type domain-containing protein n=1 Tax=Mytilus galloprovincialis TaxID=29158 RepID=A0A8B6BN80_MYTGA|nr:Hypothetical predicted protein [Mytilus galloprovincialis]